MQAKAYLVYATLLLEEEGDRALLVAAHWATTIRLAGDHAAAQMWENVVEALLQLRVDAQKPDAQPLH